MNIFNQNEVIIEKIITAKKLCQPYGYDTYVSECRGGSPTYKSGFYSLIFSIEGECDFIFNDMTLNAKKNSIIFLDNRTPFHQVSKKDYYVYCINFTASSGFIQQPNMEITEFHEKYLTLFIEATAAFEQRKPGYMLYTKSILFKLLATIKSDNMKLKCPTSKLDKLVFSIDYINANISNPQLSIEQLAYELNISSTYLRKIFIGITGL